MKDNSLGARLIFLISLPRSGSTLLQTLLGQHPDIFTHSESWILLPPMYWLREPGLVAPSYGGESCTWALKEMLSRTQSGIDTYLDAVRKLAWTIYGSCLDGSGKKCFLDKSPPYYLILEDIATLFPAAKFLVLLRNPAAVLGSIARHWFDGRCGHILTSPVHLHSLFVGPQALLQGIATLGDNCLVIKYEDLITSPETTLGQISDHLGIAFDDSLLSYEFATTSRLGDWSLASMTRPTRERLDNWTLPFESYSNYHFALRYVDYLGPKTYSSLGYDYTETRSQIVNIRRERNPLSRHWDQVLHLAAALASCLSRSFHAGNQGRTMEWRNAWQMHFPDFPPLMCNPSRIEGLAAEFETSVVERLKPQWPVTAYWAEGIESSKTLR